MTEKLIRKSSMTENTKVQEKFIDQEGKSKENDKKFQKIMGSYLAMQIIYS